MLRAEETRAKAGGSELAAIAEAVPAGNVHGPLRMVTRAQKESSAAAAEKYRPDMAGLDYRETVTDFDLPPGTFFDLALLHLLTTATMDQLRAVYPPGRFEARRFRPNIVIPTGPDQQGFVENDWIGHEIAIGEQVRLRVTGPCPRCVMTTLHKQTYPRTPASFAPPRSTTRSTSGSTPM